jgi:hypothetical protein
MLGEQAPAGEVDDHRLDLDLRHPLRRVNRLADRRFGCLQIDDNAALQADGALMPDPEDPREMCAPSERLDLVDRLQLRDDSDDLAGSNVENRQDGALARGQRLQAWRQTMT